MKILLISPCVDDDVVAKLLSKVTSTLSKKKQSRVMLTPIAVATVAALTPSDHEVHIHDENMRGPVEPLLKDNHYDIIGISALFNQFGRTFTIVEFCKKNKIPGTIVLGGSGTTALPTGLKTYVDVIFFGEAEETWPQFLEDFQAGRHKSIYQQFSKPDLSKSPIPRWDIIREDMSVYKVGMVQTTRGCPFDCVFCDVIYIYGRKIRYKPVEQVLEEIRTLEDMGLKFIIICDDNFAGNKDRAKEILRQMIKLNNSFKFPLQFFTQIDITIANDEELLELMADANLSEVCIGIESVNKESLKDFNKLQNISIDIPSAVRKIQSYGISVIGSMIIGADSDDKSAFKQTADFINEVNLVNTRCFPLIAMPGTKLWYQLRREGRILYIEEEYKYDLDAMTNVIPKKMTRTEILIEFANYWDKIYDPLDYTNRVIGFIKGINYKPKVKRALLPIAWHYRKMISNIFWDYFVKSTPENRKVFFTILRATMRFAPYMLPRIFVFHLRFVTSHKLFPELAQMVRERIAWEELHPEKIRIADRFVPIPQKIQEEAKAIFASAYSYVRKKISDREVLYKVIFEAMIDYIDRFGETFERLDEYQTGYIKESLDRIIATTTVPEFSENCELPLDQPPPHFVREIFDGIDRSIRFQTSKTEFKK